MRFDIMTLFPEAVSPMLNASILGRAQKKGLIEIHTHQIRDYTANRQNQVDDYPYGGGRGAIMQCDPCGAAGVQSAMRSVRRCIRFFFPPAARLLIRPRHGSCNQATTTSSSSAAIMRASISGFWTNASMRKFQWAILCSRAAKFLPWPLLMPSRASFPAYSATISALPTRAIGTAFWNIRSIPRPDEWHGLSVPEVLRSGDHAKVARWQKKQAILRTLHRRPDLFYKLRFPYKTRAERKFIAELEAEDDAFRDRNPKNLDYRK